MRQYRSRPRHLVGLVFSLLAAVLVVSVAGVTPASAAPLATTTSVVTVTPDTHAYGTASTMKIVVRDRGNHPAQGSANFLMNGKVFATAKLDATGTASTSIAPSTVIGRHDVQGVYVPPATGATMSGSHGNVAFFVTRSQVTWSVTYPRPTVYGSRATINVHFSGGHITPALATLKLNGYNIGKLPVHGSGDVFFRPTAGWTAGHQALTIFYSGNSYNMPSSRVINLAIAKAPTTTKLDAPASLPYLRTSTAHVTVSGAGAKPSDMVSLNVDGQAHGTARLSNGAATLTLPAVSGGRHVINVRYAGDKFHNGSSASAARLAPSSQCPATARACVDLTHSETWLQSNGKVTYGPVSMSSGRPGYRTPAGTYNAYWHDIDHRSSEFNGAPMPYSVFFNGGIAFHEGDVNVESHGCIHLSSSAAQTYYYTLHDGDQVYVYGYAPH